jgi:pyruvate dehydrogenase E2 component (dihydrolipoamide acetyltransferase)
MATIIEMPKLSDTMTAGTLVNWLKEEGEAVSNGDMIAEIETDKATMELEIFDDGILLKQFVAAGDQVDIGTPIAAIGDDGETVEAPAPTAAKEELAKVEKEVPTDDDASQPPSPANIPAPAPGSIKQQPAPTAPPESEAGPRTRVSPLARRLAAEKGIDLTRIRGSGPDGRIVKADVLAAASGDADALLQSTPESATTPAQSTPIAIPPGASIAEEADLPLSNMRGIIASRLVESKQTVPHFYLETEIDAGPLMQLRAALNDKLAELPPEQGGIKFSVTDFILKGSAEALRRVPQVNASWMGDRIRQHGAVHLSLAIAVPSGLVTPKIENAQSKTLRQVAVEAKDLAARARDKKLRPDEFTGSTFTISSLGMLGIDSFFAIINPPNAAILSVGTIVKKPVVNERDEIVPGLRMKIGMSCDHRVVDGATGAQYLAALKTILETPALMLV